MSRLGHQYEVTRPAAVQPCLVNGVALQHLVDPGWLAEPEALGNELAALVRRALSP